MIISDPDTYFYVAIPLWIGIGSVISALIWWATKELAFIEALTLRAFTISASFSPVPIDLDSQIFSDYVWLPIWSVDILFDSGARIYAVFPVYAAILTPLVGLYIYIMYLLKKLVVMKTAARER